ncbi:hypothetical protein H8S45_12310 [Agathobaculum sp. NSJ-28]|uniref:Uncharacterized protein n=1 Tax=Agathobaculum faecis TaxID=2763013 RepID=A0A923LY52_9FIRM|nr:MULTISPECIES: hypothetical protein [Agathobaculum]MBC5726235.1 hypothetical protein [Agathobaculum faecis]
MLILICVGLICIIVIQILRIAYLNKKVEKLALKERLLTQIIEDRCIPYYTGE